MPEAELRGSREVLPGQWLQTYRLPSIASAAKPGQYLYVRLPPYPPAVMPRPFHINGYDRVAGTFSIQFRETDAATAWLARYRPGDSLDVSGPLGRTFELYNGARHVLLIASDAGSGMAGVRALADEAVATSRQVTVLFGAGGAATVYPSSLLPDEVEYVVATHDGSFGERGSVVDLVPRFEAWADQAFASGSYEILAALARLASGRLARLGVAALGNRRAKQQRRRAWLQVAIDQTAGCTVGTCLGCVIMGTDGPQRVCREGPVFASDEIAWEARWP
jgi:dihydroorotate dehydrogenase electron transfer subunit